MRKLLLFDIDGTMLLTHGVGRHAMEEALSSLCRRPISSDGVSFSGRTDPAIIQDILFHNGISRSQVTALLPEALMLYTEAVRNMIEPPLVEVLPGVRELVQCLTEQPGTQLALVTGNLEETAYLKLDAAGLDAYFQFGAFGSDHEDREALPPLAVKRAKQHTGHHFTGKNVVIIGDTEHDIRCGVGIGAFSVGVCTGQYRRADLELHTPDLLLDDLCDAPRFVQHVLYA